MKPHNSSMLPAIPLVAPDPGDASPAEMVSLLINSSELSLPGFSDSSAQDGHWLHPSVPFVAARKFDEEEAYLAPRQRRWGRMALAAGGLAVAGFSFSVGLVAATYSNDWLSAKVATGPISWPAWSIVDVVPTGVMITLDGSKPILLPVGAKLPNGDSVVSVSPEHRTAFLESTTVVLRPLVASSEPSISKEQQ